MSSATANSAVAPVDELELSSSATWGASRLRNIARRDVAGMSFATTDLGARQERPAAAGVEIRLLGEAAAPGHWTGAHRKQLDAAYVYTSGILDRMSVLDAVLRAWESGGIGGHAEAVVTLSDSPRSLLFREFDVEWPAAVGEPERTLLAALLAIPRSGAELLPRGEFPAPHDLFRQLADDWKRATLNTSSMTRMVLHPAYQRIIGIGPSVLPYLLAELRREPDWWFAALQAVSGEDPVAPSERGDLLAMTRRWIAWGQRHGYFRE